MSQNQNCEKLFLLEILVENIQILQAHFPEINECDENFEQTFCLSVKFGDLPCFDMYHKVSDDDKEIEQEDESQFVKLVWREGKNCLLPRTAVEMVKILERKPLVLVLRQNNSDDGGSVSTVGKTEIPFGDEMVRMVRETEHWLSEDPISKSLQDKFPMTGADDSLVGTIQLVVRLTCLGPAVFTSFQISSDGKFKFIKDDKKRFDDECKACAPGRTVSCADVERELSPLPSCSSNHAPNSVPSVWVLAKGNDSKLVCSCSQPSFVPKIKVVKKPRKLTSNHKKPPKNVTANTVKVNPARRRKSLFLPGPKNHRHNATIRHDKCRNLDRLVPVNHGWAWKSTVPVGLKLSEMQGWQPGCFQKGYLRSMKNRPEVKLLCKSMVRKENGARSRRKIDVVPTVRLVRGNGQCHITYAPSGSKLPEHYDFSVASDDSNIELTVAMPKALPGPPKLRHQAQQFYEGDFVQKSLKKKKMKLPDDGKNKLKKRKTKSKKSVAIKPKPWDDWILKLDCKSDLKNWRPSEKLKKNWLPGFVPSEIRYKIDEAREKRGLAPLNYEGPLEQYQLEKKTPVLHVHRRNGQYSLTLRTFEQNGVQVPFAMNIARPDDFSDDSDVEFDFRLPPKAVKQFAHSQTQYRIRDFASSPAAKESVVKFEESMEKPKSLKKTGKNPIRVKK